MRIRVSSASAVSRTSKSDRFKFGSNLVDPITEPCNLFNLTQQYRAVQHVERRFCLDLQCGRFGRHDQFCFKFWHGPLRLRFTRLYALPALAGNIHNAHNIPWLVKRLKGEIATQNLKDDDLVRVNERFTWVDAASG